MAEMDRDTIYPPSEPEYGLAGDAIRREQIEGGGVGTEPSPAEGMRRHPSEAPPARVGPKRAFGAVRWPALAALLGFGGALWWRRRRRA